MATLVLGAGAAVVAGGLNLAAGGAAATALIATATAVGAYIDNTLVYPAIFDEGTQEQKFGSIRLSSAEEGTPIWRVHGRLCRIPGLLVFANPSRPVTTGGGSGKRAEPVSVTHYTDLAWIFGRADAGLDKVERILIDGRNLYDNRDPVRITGNYGNDLIINYDRFQIPSGTISQGRRIIGEWQMEIRTAPVWGDAISIVSASTFTFFSVLYVDFTLSGPHGVPAGQSALFRFDGTFSGALTGLDRKRYFWATSVDSDTIRIVVSPGIAGSLTFSNATVRKSQGRPLSSNPLDLTKLIPGGPVASIGRFGLGQPNHAAFSVSAVEELPNGEFAARLQIFPKEDEEATEIIDPIEYAARFSEMPAGGPLNNNHPLFPSPSNDLDIYQPRILYDENIIETPAGNTSWSYLESRASSGLGTEDQQQSSLLVDLAGDALAPAYRDSPLFVVRDINLSSTGNRIGNAEAFVKAKDEELGEVIQNILEPRGLAPSKVDVSSLGVAPCEGFAYSGNVEGQQILQPIALAYDLLSQETGDGIRFFERKDATVVTVPESDWDAQPVATTSGLARLRGTDANNDQPVRSLTITYYDRDEDLVDGSVTHVDQSVTQGEDRSLRLPLTLSSQQAYEIARRLTRQGKASRIQWAGTLPHWYDTLQESDIIETTIGGLPYRFLLLRVDIGTDHRVLVEGIEEPTGIGELTPNSSPSTAAGDGLASDGVIGPAPLKVEVVTQSWRSDRPSYAGYHIAATPYQSTAWRGGTIFRSTDGGDAWRVVGSVPSPATSGFVAGGSVNILPQAEPAQVSFTFDPDEDDPELGPEIQLYAGSLASTTAAKAASGEEGLALIGSEFVGLQRTTLTGTRTYVATNIHRGLYGSPTGSHSEADRVLLIDDALVWLPHSDGDYNRTHLLKVVQPGQTIDDVTAVEVFVAPDSDHELTERYDVSGLTVTDTRDGVLLTWDSVDGFNLERYEVRRGSTWNGAEVVAKTDDTWTVIRNTPPGARNYMVRAQFAGGLYSPSWASVSVTPTDPDGAVFAAEAVQTASPDPAPPASDPVQWTARGLGLKAGEYSGTYTLFPEIDAGSVANWHWSVEVDGYERDNRLTTDFGPDLITDFVEAMVWTTYGRPTSKSHTGSTFSVQSDDASKSTTQSGLASYGYIGSYGQNARVAVECRFDVDGLGTWSTWGPFREGIRTAQSMQVRLLFSRWSENYSRIVTAIRAAARA